MELLVVMAIIAILAALLLPALSRARARAQSAQCRGNLRQLGIALRLYVDDFNAYPMQRSSLVWADQLDTYLHQGTRTRVAPGDFIVKTGVFECASQRFRPGELQGYAGSYAYNEWGYWTTFLIPDRPQGLAGYAFNPPDSFPSQPTRESDIAVPAGMFALGDGFSKYRSGRVVVSSGLSRDAYTFGEREDDRKRAEQRHGGRLNVAFCDGHVEAVGLKTLFFDRTDAALQKWNADHLPHRDRMP